MKALRPYLTVLNLILMGILLGTSLSVLTTSESKTFGWISFVLSMVFLLLTLDSIRITRKTLFKVRENKAYGQPFTKSVERLFHKPKPHPLLENYLSIYYIVPAMDGSTEYIERARYYKWLTRVWAFQNSRHRTQQQSPLGQEKWAKELGGMNRYSAYMYILEHEDIRAIDPESTYHVKKLRISPWNIILLADQFIDTSEL